jgi:hypothetical protein
MGLPSVYARGPRLTGGSDYPPIRALARRTLVYMSPSDPWDEAGQ